MKKELFLSFDPSYFKPLLYGMKKYEYRKKYVEGESRVFLYLSKSVRKVVGVLEFGVPIRLDEIRNHYRDRKVLYKRIRKQTDEGYMYAIPIKSFTLLEKPITLNELKEHILGFKTPHSYFFLDRKLELKEYLYKQKLQDNPLFTFEHPSLYLKNLAVTCEDLERTDEFDEIDELVKKNQLYQDILPPEKRKKKKEFSYYI